MYNDSFPSSDSSFCHFWPKSFLHETPTSIYHSPPRCLCPLCTAMHCCSALHGSCSTRLPTPCRPVNTFSVICSFVERNKFKSHCGKEISIFVKFVRMPRNLALFADSPRMGYDRAESSLQRPKLTHLPPPRKTG